MLVHGLGGSCESWKYQIPSLQQYYNLIVVDLPGHGKSKSVNFAGQYTFKNISEGLLEIIEHLGLTQVHLLGVSIGNYFCMHFGFNHPEKVKSMVMAGAMLKFNRSLKFLFVLSVFLGKFIGYRKYFYVYSRLLLPKEMHYTSRKHLVKEVLKRENKEIEKWIAFLSNTNKELKELLKVKATIPMLFVTGDNDSLFIKPIRKYVEDNPNYEMILIKNSGHVVHIEGKLNFNNIAIEFFKSHKLVS